MRSFIQIVRAMQLVCIMAFCLALVGCGGSRNPVDQFLDHYEEIVKKWESKSSGTLSLDDINEMNKLNIDFADKLKQLQTGDKWSSAQHKRYLDLSTRFSKVLLKISHSPPKFTP